MILTDGSTSGDPRASFFRGEIITPTAAATLPPPTFERGTTEGEGNLVRGQGENEIQSLAPDAGLVLGGVVTPPSVPSKPRGLATYFDIPLKGQTIVLLIDGSGSMMEGGKQRSCYSVAVEKMLAAVRHLSMEQRFNVIIFGSRPVVLASEPLVPVQSNIDRAEKFLLSNPDCGGATEMETALAKALTFSPNAIALVTDGLPNEKAAILLAEARYLRKKLAPSVQIHTVGMMVKVGSEPDHFLKKLAEQNDGTYVRWTVPPALASANEKKPAPTR